MKKTFILILKVITSIFLILLFSILIIGYIGAMMEEPPGHPLDFQDINDTVLPKSIYSVEDGLPYALNRAHEWRQDAVLTGLEIVSEGKKEIENNTGSFEYIFEFPYINETKPSGIMFIFVDTNSNSIDFVSVSHDGEYETREIKELRIKNLAESIKKVYDVAIKYIGEDNIFKYEQPFVAVKINSDFAIFEASSSKAKQNEMRQRVKIDMKTFNIIEEE